MYSMALIALLLVTLGGDLQEPKPSTPPVVPPEQAMLIAQGWTLLGEGRSADAEAIASRVLADDPRSLPAVDLAITAEIAGGHSSAALDLYERWLNGRTFDEPRLLARIASAVLREQSGQTTDMDARAEAIQALVRRGDRQLVDALRKSAATGNKDDLRALAMTGDADAVSRLATQAASSSPRDRLLIAQALAASQSLAAVSSLTRLLGDAQPDVRVAAAEGLGRLHARDAVAPLKAVLADERQPAAVRSAAARALYRIGDPAGKPRVDQALASSDQSARLDALDAMSDRPDADWLQAVHDVAARAPDSATRLRALELLAPFDLLVAKASASTLLAGSEAAPQAGAARFLASMSSDLPELRQFLAMPDGRVRVRAAIRIVDLAQ